jgi:hypothetical protein
MLRKAPKKIFIEFEVGVKSNFENSQFSCFSMGVKISKIHNSKTIRDKKNSDSHVKLSFFEFFNVISKLKKSKIFETA